MEQSNLFFNILTFDFPKENQVFYFSDTENGKCHKIHKSIFPKNITTIFPEAGKNGTDFIFTTFTGETDGFKPLSINFETENHDFLKRFYNRKINHYFRVNKEQIVKVGFIKENQIWVPVPVSPDSQIEIFDKFTIKVQIGTVSRFPELLISYDGISKVMKQSVAELMEYFSPTLLKWVKVDNQLRKWEFITQEDVPDYSKYHPVLNKAIQAAIGIPEDPNPKDNRYTKYLEKITRFYSRFLIKAEFQEVIPLNSKKFLPVQPVRISNTSDESNKLLFGTNTGIVPKYCLRDYKPFKSSPYQNIHFFFIFHQNDQLQTKKVDEVFAKGYLWFKGLYNYANILYHTEENFSIRFKDRENPVDEIEKVLSERDFKPDVQYIAIYITPYSKYEKDKQKREIYYRVKEILLKRNITSQAIDPTKMEEQGEGWVFSLPNIAVAILAKLDGIPWRLNTPFKNELIVGIGAFKHVEENIQYIGSAFSFSNNGKFNGFEYFMKHEIELLSGKIAHAVRKYATINEPPERLIIHFYKTMSENEMEHIENALHDLDLPIPVFIISINKTESEDIVAFDKNWNELMPPSGTIINIGRNKYLLFNNTRYPDGSFSKNDGYPFPIKLGIDCTHKEQLNDIKVIRELIDQVYQFSRMYWKSVRQQNLPVTIKYPEMVAQIAPHFTGSDIPPYGKNNLWFL